MNVFHSDRFDPLLLNSPLRRPGVAAIVCAALVFVIAWTAVSFVDFFSSLRPDIAVVFTAALAGATLLSIVPLVVLWFLDRRERETPWLFAVAFLWGGFIATGLALPFNNAILRSVAEWVGRNPFVGDALGPEAALLIGAPLAAPIVEEVTKGLGLVALFVLLRAEFDNMRDGFVYGALIGLGFNWFEAPLYVAQTYAEFGTPGWGMQFGWRYALFGFSGHAMFTALFGAGLGLALQTRRLWLKVLAPLAGLVLAVAAHAYNNVLPLLVAIAAHAAGEAPAEAKQPPPDIGLLQAWLTGSIAQLTLFLPFLLVFAVALWRSGVWERRVIREELAEEVGACVTAPEYAAIERDAVFRTRRIDEIHPQISRALVHAQHELAFRKRRMRNEGRDPEADRLVAAWRKEIQLLRAMAASFDRERG
jgi:RsiW-degrading membrane proteinase PrsW (M82 family)